MSRSTTTSTIFATDSTKPATKPGVTGSNASRGSTTRLISFWPGGSWKADVDDACENVIRQGRSHAEWRHRRPWSLYDPERPRLSFRNRLRLVLDETSDEWRRTVEHYSVRNDIAHGSLLSQRIDVSSVIEDFFRIQSSLTRD